MRRLILLLGLLTILGCSGLTSLVVINNLPDDATVTLTANEKTDSERMSKDGMTWKIPAGGREEAIAWYFTPPEEIKLHVKTANTGIQHTFTKADYPNRMAAGSSAGGQFILELQPTGVFIRPPTPYDSFLRNPAPYLAISVILIVAILFARKVVKRPNLAADPKLTDGSAIE